RREKRRPSLTRFDQHKRELRTSDLDRDPRDSGPRPKVGNRDGSRRKKLQKEEAIQDDVLDEPCWVSGSNESLRSLPPADQRQILSDRTRLGVRQAPTKNAVCAFREDHLGRAAMRLPGRQWAALAFGRSMSFCWRICSTLETVQ